MPTTRTRFRTREPSVKLDNIAPIPSALIAQLSNQLTPSSVGDRTRQSSVLDHVFHRQRLRNDGLVFSHQSRCQLVQEILTSVSNLSMDFGNVQSCLLSIARTLLLAAQRLLSVPQPAILFAPVLGVGNLLSVTSRNQTGNPCIQPNRFVNLRQWLNSMVIHQQRNSPPPRRFQPDSNGGWLNSFGKLPRPTNGQRFFAFSKVNLPVFVSKTDLVNSALPPLRFFLKLGYCVLPAQKLVNAVCKCLKPCCRGTQLTSLRKDSVSSRFHSVSMADD